MLYVDPFANRPCKAAYRLSERLQVYQNKCVNGIFKNITVAEPVGPVKNGFLFFTSP